ncbi:MAG: hypothetical protein Rubg2KO_15560 [Rubricoccaceae bacterium]
MQDVPNDVHNSTLIALDAAASALRQEAAAHSLSLYDTPPETSLISLDAEFALVALAKAFIPDNVRLVARLYGTLDGPTPHIPTGKALTGSGLGLFLEAGERAPVLSVPIDPSVMSNGGQSLSVRASDAALPAARDLLWDGFRHLIGIQALARGRWSMSV